MMTVKLLKPHKQNGKTIPAGQVIRVPYRLGVAMCDKGFAIRASQLTAQFKAKQRAENANKAEEKDKAEAKAKKK